VYAFSLSAHSQDQATPLNRSNLFTLQVTPMLQKDVPILLVDDSMAMRQTVKNVLMTEGFSNVHVASNGKEALAKVKRSIEENLLYKIIFLDWNMPEMDGLEFLKTCRTDMGLKDIAIIMLTAVSDQKSVVQALGIGATSYITKPVSAETILKKLEQIGGWLETHGKTS
jgi:two-component system chemotaxis response regulator CheY